MQALAAEDPQLAPAIDQLRNAKPGSTVKIRINSDETYSLREAGLIDADTHRALREKFTTMPEVEVDVTVVRDLHEPNVPRPPRAKPPIHDAPSLEVEVDTAATAGSIAEPARTARPVMAIDANLPAGAKVIAIASSDRWVRYELPNGDERVRFRSEEATVATTVPKEGRNYTKNTGASVMNDGKVAVSEGVHRTVGSSQGDVVGSDVGGVRGRPGVLDYEASGFTFDPSETFDAKTRKIDYKEPELSAGDAQAERNRRDNNP